VIIDMSNWLKAEREPPTAEGAEAEHEGSAPLRAALEKQAFPGCRHLQMTIDDKQRTVKCTDCKMWLDPVWCLRELFRYYETRVDQRLTTLKELEDRYNKRQARSKERKAKTREQRAATMAEELKRAAYNEYRAKVLAATALRQRLRADKIEAELS